MEEFRKSRWEGNEHWFKFEHQAGLRRFESISSLGITPTAIALRALKYHLEDEFGFEITDELFIDIFRKVCNFRPVPGLGAYASLEFIQPLQRILESHGVSQNYLGSINKVFRIRVDNPRCYKKLFLHIPHSSTRFPEESKYTFKDLDKKERLLIDYYTDELFIPNPDSDQISRVVFPFCRLCCDVERLIKDPLDKDGLGFLYQWHIWEHDERPTLFSFCSKYESFRLYADHHAEVSKKLVEMGEGTLLIDCHSFSALPNLLNSNPPDIDICIGYNEDETCPDKVVIGNIAQYFRSLGYKVGINKPFSNSKTFAVPVTYHSVMIEVNKRLYMNEQTLEKTEGFEKLKNAIQSLYDLLLLTFHQQ